MKDRDVTLPDAACVSRTSSYWDSVDKNDRSHSGGGRHWRDFCDALHARLIDRWLGGAHFERALKTDLFDEATGVGLLGRLASRATAVHGFDVSPRIAVSAAAKNRQARSCVTDARAMAYRSRSFDLVFSNSTLDHFADAADIGRALAELHRVMVPGGTLLLTFDNLSNPVVALRSVLPFQMLRRLSLVPYFIGATLTMAGLHRELAAAGFTLVEQTTLMHVPRLPAILACRLLDRSRSKVGWLGRRFMRFESLDRLPSRQLTGYFVAALARKVH